MSENDEGQQNAEGPAELRARLDELKAENKELKAERRQRAYTDAGIPEGAYDVFDSMYSGELNTEALRTFAQEKGFRLPDEGGEQQQAGEGNPQVQAQQAGQARLDAVDAAKLPTDKPDLKTQIMDAVAEGDFTKSFELKNQLLDEQRRAARQQAAI